MCKLIAFLLLTISFNSSAQIKSLVKRVIDGDTFTALIDRKEYTCRIANIDAPELKQDFGAQAYQNLKTLIEGKELLIDTIGRDKYKRFLVDGWFNNAALDSTIVRNGWAWYYFGYAQDISLLDLMLQAEITKLGLWSCGKEKVCPPWLFRQYTYRNRLKYCNGCAHH